MNDTIRLKTTISSPFLKHALMKGLWISSIGLVGILIAGVFIPVIYLKTWGWLIFLIGIGFIAGGMIPYKKLSKLQLKPNELLVFSNHLEFYSKGEKKLTIPLNSIDKIEYFENKNFYGIGLFLKHPTPEKIIIHKNGKWINKIRREGQQYLQSDLFFIYFNRRAFKELQLTCDA
ncbi:MAG: hypothetical protein Q8K60_00810 [Parachlamydiaceae bacterium]|nr:hypothetical protein [Parachlamydiaceae bacterium]